VRPDCEVAPRGSFLSRCFHLLACNGLSYAVAERVSIERAAKIAGSHTGISQYVIHCQLDGAASRFKSRNLALLSVVVAGERYGMGSSRDWAAKGQGVS
jgi:aconitase A